MWLTGPARLLLLLILALGVLPDAFAAGQGPLELRFKSGSSLPDTDMQLAPGNLKAFDSMRRLLESQGPGSLALVGRNAAQIDGTRQMLELFAGMALQGLPSLQPANLPPDRVWLVLAVPPTPPATDCPALPAFTAAGLPGLADSPDQPAAHYPDSGLSIRLPRHGQYHIAWPADSAARFLYVISETEAGFRALMPKAGEIVQPFDLAQGWEALHVLSSTVPDADYETIVKQTAGRADGKRLAYPLSLHRGAGGLDSASKALGPQAIPRPQGTPILAERPARPFQPAMQRYCRFYLQAAY